MQPERGLSENILNQNIAVKRNEKTRYGLEYPEENPRVEETKRGSLPKVLSLLSRIQDFLPCQRLFKLGSRSANFAKDILVMLCFDDGQCLADDVLV